MIEMNSDEKLLVEFMGAIAVIIIFSIIAYNATIYVQNVADNTTPYNNIEYNSQYEIKTITKYYNRYGAHYNIEFYTKKGIIKSTNIKCHKTSIIEDGSYNYIFLKKGSEILEMHIDDDVKIIQGNSNNGN